MCVSLLCVQASKSPKIIEIVHLANVQATLERIGAGLGHLQKALGDFLERQRAAFSRFYFVGDEDLLEIIGNGRDPNQVCALSVAVCFLAYIQ